ncbi:MAG: flagellar export chaperone FliS [Syntrophomonadales bacterium]|jgi:flagellar protein FliS
MSIKAQVYASYKNSAVETASPGKLLLMLYNGAIRDLDTAIQRIAEKDFETAHNRLVRAQDIITEFMCTLNMDYEISGKLLALYEYLHRRLVEANARKDVEIINEVRGFLIELRDTWQEALNKTSSTAPRVAAGGSSGINVQG